MTQTSRIFLLTAASLLSLLNPIAGTAEAPDAQVTVSDPSCIELDIRFDKPEFTVTQTDEGEVTAYVLSGEVSDELPRFGWWIALPEDGAEIEIINRESSIISLEAPFAFLESQSNQSELNAQTPRSTVELGESARIRGLTLAPLIVNQVRVNPGTNEVEAIDRLHFRINFRHGESGLSRESRLYPSSTGFQRMIESLVLNSPPRDQDDIVERGFNEYYLFVMQDDDEVLRTVQPLIDWKLQTGNRAEALIVPNHRNADEITARIQGIWDELVENDQHPFDYLVLVGSEDDDEVSIDAYPSPHGNLRHFDMQYTLLEGDDLLPECALTRLRAENIEQLENVITRTISYEKNPNWEDDWLDNATVIEEQLNGWRLSVHDACLYMRDALSEAGFEHVNFQDGIDPDVVSEIIAIDINAGTGIIAARSTAEEMRDLDWLNENLESNGFMPFMMMYGEDPDRVIQPLVSLGTPDEPKGIVAGSFNWGSPRTADNNTLASYMCRTLTVDRLPIGYARIAVHLNYMLINPHLPQYCRRFLADHTVYGEPGMLPWMGRPVELQVSHPEAIPPNATHIRVEAVAAGGEVSTEGLIACIMEKQEGFIFQSVGVINAEGYIDLVIDDDLQDGVQLTLSGEDFCPYTAEIPIGANLIDLVIDEVFVNDQGGNNDEIVNPGEPVGISMVISNANNRQITNASLELSLLSGEFDLDVREFNIPDLRANDSLQTPLWAGRALDNMDESKPLRFLLSLNSDQGLWTGVVEVEAEAPDLVLVSIGGPDIVDSVAVFRPEIRNIGSNPTPRLTATLIPLEEEILVMQGRTEYASIEPGESLEPAGEELMVMRNSFTVPGQQVHMRLLMEGEDFSSEIVITVQSGSVDTNTPFGPDAYGYYCFDDTDDRWDLAPEYEWFEIDPEHWDCIFDGIPLDVEETRVVNIPFDFQYYGRDFNQITISEFGCVALGSHEEYLNYEFKPTRNLAGNPPCLIAPLWTNDAWNEIFYYHADDWGCFIIEWISDWTRMELVIYDPELWPTFTGDGGILAQYSNEVNEGDFSVGISGPNPGDGLTYMYRALYHPGAAPIAARRAVFYTTGVVFGNSQVIAGHVYDSETEEPLPEVLIYSQYGFCIITNELGWFYINSFFAPVELHVRCLGYIDTTVVIDDLGQEDTLYVDIPLNRVDFGLDPVAISRELAVGSRSEDVIVIENNARGRIEWSSRLMLPDEIFPDAELFDPLFSWDASGITHNNGIRGIERIGDLFYVCASALDGDPPALIYVFDNEGNLIRTFSQPNENDPSGFYDLATDGEILIGGDGGEIVLVDPLNGEEIERIQSDFNRCLCLACDPAADRLYVAEDDWNHVDVLERDDQGYGVVDEFDLDNPWRPQQVDWMGIRGLAWYPNDPHNCHLYALHRNHIEGSEEVYNLVSKVNLFNHRTATVTCFEPIDEVERHSLAIFDGWYPAVWSLGCILRSEGDVTSNLYWLGLNTSWIETDPMEGIVEPDAQQDVALNLDAANLEELVYDFDLCFTARGGVEKRLPIRLAVGQAGVSPDDDCVPVDFALEMPYPNPFNSCVTVPYALPYSTEVNIEVFDMSGRLVDVYSPGRQACGRYAVVIDADDWSSGVFILRLRAGSFKQATKLVTIK